MILIHDVEVLWVGASEPSIMVLVELSLGDAFKELALWVLSKQRSPWYRTRPSI
jgi:hypothetical protein